MAPQPAGKVPSEGGKHRAVRPHQARPVPSCRRRTATSWRSTRYSTLLSNTSNPSNPSQFGVYKSYPLSSSVFYGLVRL